jgi:hypothetical protein
MEIDEARGVVRARATVTGCVMGASFDRQRERTALRSSALSAPVNIATFETDREQPSLRRLGAARPRPVRGWRLRHGAAHDFVPQSLLQ